MTRDIIEDYLYFFWAPLINKEVLEEAEREDLQQIIIRALSQSSVYIEAPAYVPNTSSREYPEEIKILVSTLADKIVAEIPGRSTEDSFWLKATISDSLISKVAPGDTHLQIVQSIGPCQIDKDSFLRLEFFTLPHQLQLRLPTSAEISAIISTQKPLAIPEGPVDHLVIPDCTLWLSAFGLDPKAEDSLYIGYRLQECDIIFEEGFTKSGDLVSAGILVPFAGFVITCTADQSLPANVSDTVAARNSLLYPDEFVFTCKPRPGLPKPPKITFKRGGPFSATLFGSPVIALPVTESPGAWLPDKFMVSFPLQPEENIFEAKENVSPVFNLKGKGTISNPTWNQPAVSTRHTLGFGRLGLALENGYLEFDAKGEFSLSWEGLQNKGLLIQTFSIRTSPDFLLFTYISLPSILARQQLTFWASNKNEMGCSGVELSFPSEAKGNFISHRKSNEFNTINALIEVNVDRPVLSNGDRIFLQTPGAVMLFNENKEITAIIAGGRMDPAIAFKNNAFKSRFSFALSNALILVGPADYFLLKGTINEAGVSIKGNCTIKFPIANIEHILPDPYITSLFIDQRAQENNIDSLQKLRATIYWEESEETELLMELDDEKGNVFTPKGLLTDEQFADRLLNFPVPHPGAPVYEQLLRNALSASGNAALSIFPDQTPFKNYQASYHSKTNTTGALAALQMLPGNVTLVDVSGRASQLGVSFYRRLDNMENDTGTFLENTGYTALRAFRIKNNELVSSGRFVRAFTLPQVQCEPVNFEENDHGRLSFKETFAFPTHGVPTRISSANKAEVALSPLPVVKYIVEGFSEEKNKYAAAAHFALPFGMNAVALFHPKVDNVKAPVPLVGRVFRQLPRDPYAYCLLNFNQPEFLIKKGLLSGAIQLKVLAEGYPQIPRDTLKLPDPSFHGAVLQTPNQFNGVRVVKEPGKNPVIQYNDASILGDTLTKQFNRIMWGEYILSANGTLLNFNHSPEAKVPLSRIDFSGFGASIFSNWLNKHATAGDVSQVKFNILIGRVAHEVIQVKSVIIPWFIPVVRTLIIERKNNGNILRTDTGWVATGPGVFHKGYVFHPGITKGIYNITSIRDTEISLPLTLDLRPAEMSGVYFDGDLLLENVVKGFKNIAGSPAADNYKLVPSKKQFGYILLGNPVGKDLEMYLTKADLQTFMTRAEVGILGGPVDCIINIAGSDQMMHLTRMDVTAVTSAQALVVAAKGTLHLPKGGSWSVVKKIKNGSTQPLNASEWVPLIRNGKLNLDPGTGVFKSIDFNDSLHVLANPLEIEKYTKNAPVMADTEYALLQSTDTQKLLFPRPSFNSKNNAAISNEGITIGEKKIFTTNPLIADPYSLLKSNTLFPANEDALTLGKEPGFVKSLDIQAENSSIAFPLEIAGALRDFIPHECKLAAGETRKLYLVNETGFKIFIDYGGKDKPSQLFTAALNAAEGQAPWEMKNKEVAIVVYLGDFKPLLTVTGNFTAKPGAKPEFNNAKIKWGEDEKLQKIVQVLSILAMLSNEGAGGDIIADGFKFAMGNSPDSWSYKCTIEEKIPVIQFPNRNQLAQLPVPAPLIVEAGLDLGVFFNLSLSTDPHNLIKAGAGVVLGFEATIQVLLITIEGVTAYGVGTAKVDVFIELPEAKPTFKFTMGFGATVAVQLPMVGYVSLTRVISLGASIDDNIEMTVGQMLRGVLTVGGGLASVSVQVEASGTVSNKAIPPQPAKWTATVRGVFTLDVSVAFVISWDFSKDFEHEIDLPHPF